MSLLLSDIVFQPALGPLQIAGLAGLLALLAVAVYARSVNAHKLRALGLLTMRLVAILTLAALLMGPSRLPEQASESARPALYVMLDTSGSMLTNDADGLSRAAYAVQRYVTADQLQRMQQSFDVRLVGFDEAVRPLAIDQLAAAHPQELASGSISRYDQSITDVLLDTPTPGSGEAAAALLVIGDGHDSSNAPPVRAAELARRRNTPIHTIAIGGTTPVTDLAIAAVPRSETLFTKETGQIAVTIHQVGLDEATTTLHLRRGGEQRQQEIRFDGRASVTIDLPIEAGEAGVHEYQITVDPAAGEAVTSNNSQRVFVQVTGRRISVLLLEGEPFWDTKFLAQSLRTDPRVELTQISQLSDDRAQRIVTRADGSSAAAPRTSAEWSAYDVIILGRGVENVLGIEALRAMVDYIADGGGQLVLSRGRPYDPDTPAGRDAAEALAVLEPVTWAPGLMHNLPLWLTASGRAAPSFAMTGMRVDAAQVVADLPPLSIMNIVEREKPATIVLARIGRAPQPGDTINAAARAPAIVMMNYGRGRVFAVLGEGLWRWSFLPPDLTQYKGVFDAFWSNTVRWLAMGGQFDPGEQIALKLSKSSVRLGDPLLIDAITRFPPPPDFAPALSLIDPAGRTHPLALTAQQGLSGRLSTSFDPDQVGVWTAVLEAPPLQPARQQRRFSVYDLNTERLDVAARPQWLKMLSTQTGGMHATTGESIDPAAELTRRLLAKKVQPQPTYLWDNMLLLLVLVTWMGLEWISRRQAGWL